MKYKEIAQKLSGIVGTRIAPADLERFSIPSGSWDSPLVIASNKGIVLTGWSDDDELSHRITNKKGPAYFATFDIKGIPTVDLDFTAQRGHLLSEYPKRETVRQALEAVIILAEGDYMPSTGKERSNRHDYNII